MMIVGRRRARRAMCVVKQSGSTRRHAPSQPSAHTPHPPLPRLEVEQQRARHVVLIVGLVEEDVLAVAALRREVLEHAILADAVLGAELCFLGVGGVEGWFV